MPTYESLLRSKFISFKKLRKIEARLRIKTSSAINYKFLLQFPSKSVDLLDPEVILFMSKIKLIARKYSKKMSKIKIFSAVVSYRIIYYLYMY